MPVTLKDVLALLPELFPGVQEVPLERIRSNPDNPGPPPTDEQVAELAANIAEVGLLNPIKLRVDPADPLVPGAALHPENHWLKADGSPWALADFNFRNLSGEFRHRAHQLLKKPTIKSLILNLTEEEAVILSHGDNQVRNRGWWADYKAIENLIKANPNLTQIQVGIKLKIDKNKVNRAIGLLPLLKLDARELIIRDTDNQNKGKKQISELAVFQLAALGPESPHKPGVKGQNSHIVKLWPYPTIPPETQDLVYRALQVVSRNKLTQSQTKAFVGGIKGGKPPEDYYPETKAPARRSQTAGRDLAAPISEQEMGAKTTKTDTPSSGSGTSNTSPDGHETTPPTEPTLTKPEPKKNSPNLILELLAGINPLSKIKKKVKNGEQLTTGEETLLAAHDSEKVAVRVWKTAKPILHAVWHKWHSFAKGAANNLAPHHHNRGAGPGRITGALGHQLVYLFFLALPFWVLSAFVPFMRHLIVYGLYHLARWLTVDLYSWSLNWVTHNWIQAAIGAVVVLAVLVIVPPGKRLITLIGLALVVWMWVFARTAQESSALVSKPSAPITVANVPSLVIPPTKAVTKKSSIVLEAKKISVSSNPAAAPSIEEDHGLLMKEVASFQDWSKLKPLPLAPGAIESPMAFSRLNDMAGEDYALVVGHDPQRITAVTPTNLSLAVQCASGNPLGGILGGSGAAAGFYWEDALAIHCDEVTVNPGTAQTKTVIRIVVLASGHDPFVLQCQSENEARHIVSSMEFFIRLAQENKNVPISGTPYVNQGLALNEEGRVNLLWEDSPADQAGLPLRDYLWSMDSKAQQKKAAIENALQNLSSGKHLVYAVTPNDWNAALMAHRQPGSVFSPKLKAVELAVP